jgi:response regulator RpfG family c-di-GMP phosphodiesterase
VNRNEFWPDLRLRYTDACARHFIGKISADQVVRELRHMFYEADDTNYSADDMYAMLFVPGVLLHHLKDSAQFISRWVKREIDAITTRMSNYLKNFPPEANRTLLNGYIMNYARYINQALGGGWFLNLLSDLTVVMSMQGHVYSVQIMEIACILADRLGMGDERELIRRVILCHSIEKFISADIGLSYARTLGENERSLLRGHTNATVLREMDSDELADVIDIIHGHHKWYDNQGGYPADYDRAASPNTRIMDIIAVAESIVSASDTLQRVYAPVLSPREIIAEIRAQSGTRYAPETVEALLDETVQASLAECITVGRRKACYAYYVSSQG